MRRRFGGIGLSLDGQLTLRTTNGNYVEVHHGKLRPTAPMPGTFNDFGEPFSPEGTGYTLEQARLVGVDFWLDSRGFLHVRGGDESIPQFSLVLTERDVTLWTDADCYAGQPMALGADSMSWTTLAAATLDVVAADLFAQAGLMQPTLT